MSNSKESSRLSFPVYISLTNHPIPLTLKFLIMVCRKYKMFQKNCYRRAVYLLYRFSQMILKLSSTCRNSSRFLFHVSCVNLFRCTNSITSAKAAFVCYSTLEHSLTRVYSVYL